jgi:uncharacterized protein YukE
MIAEEDRMAKILADKINERFRVAMDDLKSKIEVIDRRVSRLESENVDNMAKLIEAVFTASVKTEIKRVSLDFLRDLKDETESLKNTVASLQNQITKLATVAEGFRIDEERYKSYVDALSAEVNKTTRALGNALASFSKKMDESVESLKSRMEEIAEEVFRADAVSLENMLRTIVSGVVSERFDRLGKELFEKIKVVDDFAVMVRDLTNIVQELQKAVTELAQGAGRSGVTYVEEKSKEQTEPEEQSDKFGTI